MRQVPHYLIIGNGRVATHFKHYFSLLHLPYSSWQRQQSFAQLQEKIQQATHILLLISDSALPEFIAKHLQLCISKINSPKINSPKINSSEIKLIHFSGSLIIDDICIDGVSNVYGAHPLMTFGNDLYDLPRYQSIPFVIDEEAIPFSELLPGLENQDLRMPKSLKAKYHALCVLSGNFSCLLWQKLFSTLENDFKFPAAIAYPYLQQQMLNLMANPQTALTGPLVRGDKMTIEKNLSALQGDAFQKVYESFVAAVDSSLLVVKC
jgi:hypothetical protein